MRIVINCISLETISELTLLKTDSRITNLEIIQVQVSRAKTIGDYHLMQEKIQSTSALLILPGRYLKWE